MSDTTRRGFLAIAGVGAAGVAAATVTGASASTASAAAPAVSLPAGASGSIVAYVSDVHAGQVSVMVGENEVVVHDKDLVARLAHAAAMTEA